MVAEYPNRRPWRWRRCPNPYCRVVRRASDFLPSYRGPAWDEDDPIIRHRPECDYASPSRVFAIVREHHCAVGVANE